MLIILNKMDYDFYYTEQTDNYKKMESRHERYQKEHLENVAFEESQRIKDLEHLEHEEWIKEEKIEILKAYLADDFKLIEESENFILENILGAMDEFTLNVVAGEYEKQ